MTILVLGASGATGRFVVRQLLAKDHQVKIIVRAQSKVFTEEDAHENLRIIRAAILDLNDADLAELLKDCDAVVSCLGHNLSLKGIYGQPRQLVTDSVRKVCALLQKQDPLKPVKFILMSSSGVRNLELNEKVSFVEMLLVALLRKILPPHRDNEDATKFLKEEITKNNKKIEYCSVRPDGLIDEEEISEYELYPSPIRSAIFNAGKTSRINVAAFIVNLILDDELWQAWRGQMPLIYNKEK